MSDEAVKMILFFIENHGWSIALTIVAYAALR